jgi:peptidoglycan/xylan/chitin deacetylase (PgdA/CDA1 family)
MLNEIIVTVIMYHSVLKDPSQWGDFIISPDMLEQDLKYLQNEGYTTVNSKDLLGFVHAGIDLPEKCVMLTFDDGHFNNITYAQPLLEKYGMKAVQFIAGAWSDRDKTEQNPAYSYMNWESIAALSPVWEVGSHTWDMHKGDEAPRAGVRQLPGESDREHVAALTADFAHITDKLTAVTGKKPLAFAYPFGFYNQNALDVLLNLGYRLTFTCAQNPAVVRQGDPTTLINMGRFGRSATRSVEDILTR